MLITMKIFYSFLRKNWKTIILIIGMIISFLIFKNQKTNYYDKLKEINDNYKKEIDEINTIRQNEKKQYDENEKNYKKEIDEIKKSYLVQIQALDEKTQLKAKEILDNNDDPVELANQLSKLLGFKVENV